jgi:hypothetical protein
MGFRNSVRSLSAGQITAGTLPASVVAQAVASAAAGPRITLAQVGALGRLAFYAGISAESPATVQASSAGGAAGDQTLRVIGGTNVVTLPATGAPEIDLYAAQDPTGTWRSWIALHADNLALPDTGWLQVPLAAGVTPYTVAPYNGVQYRVIAGVTFVAGACIKTGGFANGTLIGTMPAGTAPSTPVNGLTNGAQQISFNPDRTIKAAALAGLPATIVLTQLSFPIG